MCEGQGSLACCSLWGCKKSNMTWLLNNNIYTSIIYLSISIYLYPIGSVSLENPEKYKAQYCLLNFKVICLLFLPTNGNFSSGVALISTQRLSWQNPSKIAPSIFVGGREAKSPTARVLWLGTQEEFEIQGWQPLASVLAPEGLWRFGVSWESGMENPKGLCQSHVEILWCWFIFPTYLVSSNTELINGSRRHLPYYQMHESRENLSLVGAGA